MKLISSVAYSMALTALGARLEWALVPVTTARNRPPPLWPMTTCMLVGSPTMQKAGCTGIAAMRSSRLTTPVQPSSSS